MKIFIYQIISLVIAYGCNDISGSFLQKSKSQCYNQANGKINSNTLKDAVKCCMTNTVGGQRVFGVPLMQFKKLGRRDEKEVSRKGFHSRPNHLFKEESPKCTPRNKNDLTNFFNFLDEFKNQRYDSYKTEDNRWDCFLTIDYENTVGEYNNFCKRVLNTFKSEGRLQDIKKDVCDGTSDRIFPKFIQRVNSRKRSSSLVLDDIEKVYHKDVPEREQKQMVYLGHDNEITAQYDERRATEICIFENWNDLTSGLINVLFDEENEYIRKRGQKIEVVRQLECGCIPAKYSKRQNKSNW